MNNKVGDLIEWLERSEHFFMSDNIGIVESELSGRGIYLLNHQIRKNDTIISVPSTHQINFYTVLYHISKFNSDLNIENITYNHDNDTIADLKDPRWKAYKIFNKNSLFSMTSFQIITLFILAEWILLPIWSNNTIKSFWLPFFNIFPTKKEFRCIPTLWNIFPKSQNQKLFEHLPSYTKNGALDILKRIRHDWACISPILNEWNLYFHDKEIIDMEIQFVEFVHIYFIINSRCLYTEIPLKSDVADNFTMVPVVDFLNHSTIVNMHCYPEMNSFKKSGYGIGQFNIKCGEIQYSKKGEEIFLNYGAHSNEFLLNEYGFIADNNEWNFIDISSEVEKMITHSQDIDFLKEYDYWSGYTIDYNDVSFRTNVAIALVGCNNLELVKKLLMGCISEEYFNPIIKPIISKLIHNMIEDCHKKINIVKELSDVDALCKNTVLRLYQDYLKILEHHNSK